LQKKEKQAFGVSHPGKKEEVEGALGRGTPGRGASSRLFRLKRISTRYINEKGGSEEKASGSRTFYNGEEK